jgi:hypothetical protein
MQVLLLIFRALGWAVAGSAAVELLAAIVSARVRRYIAERLIPHFVWFACALCLAVILIPAYSRRLSGF